MNRHSHKQQGAVLITALIFLVILTLISVVEANPLASGLALMFFGFGLSALIGKPYVGVKINPLPRIPLPGLSNLPQLYTSLFSFDLLIYLSMPISILVWWILFRTRWGLGLRAVVENMDTAFASGRNPGLIRYQALFTGGLLAGLGAAHLSIAYTMTWAEYMTARRGFIAVALVIFSRWHPLQAIAGALIFSGAVAFQLLLQSSGIQVSPLLLHTIPYIITILVLIAWGGNRKQSAPASLGRV